MWPQGAPGFKKANLEENALFTFEAQIYKYLPSKMTEQHGISINLLSCMLLKE
jgi:hypothetical protein